ncbi:MAG: hypothetical protein ACREJB_14125 [Planctomycetaceae bacterium]
MLHGGPALSAASVRLPSKASADCLLFGRPVTVAELAAEDAAALESAILCAGRDDPQALPCWRRWAGEALKAAPLDAALRETLDRFAGRAL